MGAEKERTLETCSTTNERRKMSRMYDLHLHSILSDGEMIPIEIVRRASVLGYRTIAIADHADDSNIVDLIAAIRKIERAADEYEIELLSGVELTHVPPSQISKLAGIARNEGADLVIVHGETTVEPVAPGTNFAACSCANVDILAHPGLINNKDAFLAATNGVALEVTSRNGHNRTNGHIVRIAREYGCSIVINSDAHTPLDILDASSRRFVALGSGLTEKEAKIALSLNIHRWLSKKRKLR